MSEAQTVSPVSLSVSAGSHTGAGLFRAVEFDSPDNRAVIVDTGSPTRSIGTSECEQLTNFKSMDAVRAKLRRAILYMERNPS